MRVVVDTSVWSLFFRKDGSVDHPKVRILRKLLTENEDVILTGVILQEILQAFRSDAVFKRVAEFFEPFDLLDLKWSDVEAAADLHRTCASKGIAASTVDCQIAIAAIRNECMLLTSDRDFERIAGTSTLRLVPASGPPR